jgi:cystathionine beta-lyase/cystathionine gamma-synthase
MSRPLRARGPRLGLSSLGIHGGGDTPGPGDPVVPSLVQSATFIGGRAGDELLYTRYGNNPLQRLVGRKVAELEGAEEGLVLASGMSAIVMTTLALTHAGDHVVASAHLYGATLRFLEEELPRRGVEVTLVDPSSGRAWRRAVRAETRLLYTELPTNPTLRVFDPRPVTDLAHGAGIPLVMDATFATPVNLRPLTLGVDVVVHSATKYLGGHSDLIAGVVAGSRSVVGEVVEMMKLYGPAPDPHMVWLLDRGLRTLDVRVRRQNESALALALWLEGRPGVERVLYPGLESHPDHATARELFANGAGFGGMLSFVLDGGAAAADDFMDRLQLVSVAPSLGGVESLVSQPRHTSHRGLTARQREALDIPDGLVRLSVGLEDFGDLVEDLERALESLGDGGAR